MTKPPKDPRSYRDPVPMLKWALGGLIAAVLLLILQVGALAAIAFLAAAIWGATGFWRLAKIRRFLKTRGY